ncbi:hypothetical protein [Aeromonas sp. MR7]|uniref:hypothetical protein n=1 Tax=Aeromonas sp. MR7 TaxID=2923419 RepID=UPI001F4B6BB4|nr:hypothetical protein [Aeromonas sp. MR7]MCH7349794.1 hypothetical protein [Aeromonas sp. MR7]
MQINDRPIELSRRAEVTLDRLPESDRKKVLRSIEKVLALGLEPPYAAKLKGMENTFVIRAGLDLRIIFQVTSEFVRISDIARHDKLEQLVKKNMQGDL